ncbi:MAG: GNAT family N-acetyltransferase [Alphaproteobacteria bacterium]|nr:GNAT family N-acetyltransferase [Alphaproteobacteria bacterium]
MASKFLSPLLLNEAYNSSTFDCGVGSLNEYIKKYALQHQQSQGSRTYVAIHDNNNIAGYFTLAYGSVSSEEVPERVGRGLGRYPIPIMVLARLAVDQKLKGQGLGKSLLKQALLKTLNASEIAGLRAIVVHAKDTTAQSFYKHYGFTSSSLDELHMFLLCKDIRLNLLPKI